ncbi:NineTeen Complex (NTC) component [Dinochytrium kinnereticum]|nr:NineTeen Complex (NTC) component [Dinochytrium kinnereticum]
MARNEEKAQSMLYRFREAQAVELGVRKFEKRPASANMVDDPKEAEKWRNHVIRELTRKVAKIQDSALSEHDVRDLNDKINKQLREKRAWEYRIKELGGPDYRRSNRLFDDNGKEVPGSQGYRYFGRAKELPGVKELFEQEGFEKCNLGGTNRHVVEMEEKSKTRSDMFRSVDADYYGYRDEDDGKLLAYERQIAEGADGETEEKVPQTAQKEILQDLMFINPIKVPTSQDMEAWLIQRRKQELVNKFLGPVST